MSDETPQVGNETDEEVQQVETPAASTPSSIESLEDAKKVIEKLRSENAAKRTKNREIEEQAKKWQQHMESQKTEMERLQESKQQLEAKLTAYETDRLRNDIAREVGLDPDLAEFIVGADEDEMRARAKTLVEKTAPKQAKTPADLKAGDRGKPIVADKPTGGDFLKSLSPSGGHSF